MPRNSNRRELIINIAQTRFLISGYDAVTVDELCNLSSSTKGSFYHFFPNKEALAVDVINHVWQLSQSEMELIFTSDASADEKLVREIERVANGYLRFDGKRYYIGCPIGTLAVSLRGKGQKLTRRLNFALNHMRQFYMNAFESGLSRGQLRSNKNASDLADQFQISLQGLSTLGKAHPGNAKVQELAAILIANISDL
ncbi:MAG: TetR/AcrR family transcriptional regulator [Pseudomonadales bacterium]|nr:TetR/AcrR family transcriptional regulator [Pseudomonadales bacterium]MBO6564987.1 TetR/AcrR family transcriptional regulator [Pseudomonadales bacterium]MBO6595624.1 TetR/AcrR family transcriptional regulator [Pseudomonadales bacterium]MBO6655693.1 TetR/AcrR family transcriptional regulator [Pseudomonadales bacterium]MBO6702124.1 TetR/AcrR family transcriptional regulator [Pseudomonadales bacterium]